MADTSTRCRVWAARQLNTSECASPDELRRAFWAQLEEENFLPPGGVREAFEHLQAVAAGRAPRELPSDFREVEEIELCEEVEQFAREMFEIPPAERKARWTRLRSRCEGTMRPAARCDSLARGLEADLSRLDPEDANATRLAKALCRMVAAAPDERGAHRQEIRALWADDRGKVGRVANRLRSSYASIAALDPLLIQELIAPPEERQLWAEKFQHKATQVAGQLGPLTLIYCAIGIFGLFLALGAVVTLHRYEEEENRGRRNIDTQMRDYRNRELKKAREIEAGRIVVEELRRRRENSQDPQQDLEDMEERYEELRRSGMVPRNEGLEHDLEELRRMLNDKPAGTPVPADTEDRNAPDAPPPAPDADP